MVTTAAVVGLGWVAAPWVALVARGTLEEQQIRDWRDEEPAVPHIPRPRSAPPVESHAL
ncbi:hypothetical protein [Actinomycetospora atypica]|uniref:Uncharacterized protein n=1 Tax=Actinomycetospora atypica TaxID=1290095 RepID=A0ABV9YFT9_9PSEU